MKTEHTPGPWETTGEAFDRGWCAEFDGPGSSSIGIGTKGRKNVVALVVWPRAYDSAEHDANARLIAAAPDHALIAAAICAGHGRWETFEFCIGGIRHCTKLDEFGVPVMTSGMRAAISRALNGGE